MSLTEFVGDEVRSFRRKYPPKAGWMVYQLDYTMGIELLPVFVRLHAKDVLIHEDLWVKGFYADGKRARPVSLIASPYVGNGPGLHDAGWFGTVSLRWRGSLIHFKQQHLVQSGLSSDHLTLIATKDRAAVDDLCKKLVDFWRKTLSPERNIHIVNTGGSIPLPRLKWDDLIVKDSLADDIRRNVEAFLKAKPLYKRMGLNYRRGILLTGAPGTGKTSAAKVIMSTSKARCLALNLTEELKDSTIENAFREAARESPSILLIEDLDKMMAAKGVSLSFVLNLLDGLDTFEGFLLIATSNEPEKIDPALLHRPSRFDRVWHFGLPGTDERRRLIDRRAQGRFSTPAMALAAEATAGMTLAMVQEVVVGAALQAVHGGRKPVDSDLSSSVEMVKNQLRSNQRLSGAIPKLQQIGFENQ